MAEEVYGLGKSDLEKLRALIQKVNGESGLNARGEEPRGFSQSPDSYAAYTTSGISARSGTTPGSGTVIIKKLNRSSEVLETVTSPTVLIILLQFIVYTLTLLGLMCTYILVVICLEHGGLEMRIVPNGQMGWWMHLLWASFGVQLVYVEPC